MCFVKWTHTKKLMNSFAIQQYLEFFMMLDFSFFGPSRGVFKFNSTFRLQCLSTGLSIVYESWVYRRQQQLENAGTHNPREQLWEAKSELKLAPRQKFKYYLFPELVKNQDFCLSISEHCSVENAIGEH